MTSNSMLDKLLLKARIGCVGQPVASRYSSERSPFPSVAESTMGDSVLLRWASSLPTIAERALSNCVASEWALQEPCSNRQADARLAK